MAFTFAARLTGPVILLLSLFFHAAAQAEPSATLHAYGEYDSRRSGELIQREKTASGVVTPVARYRLIRKNDVILAQLGGSFGFEVDLHDFPPGPVTLTIRTLRPPLTNPETGRTTTEDVYDWTVTGRNALYFGYTFDHKWELAEGIWTKQILYNGKVLVEKKFKIVIALN